VQLVAYGSGRERLADVTAEVERSLAAAMATKLGRENGTCPTHLRHWRPKPCTSSVRTAHGGFEEIRAMLDRDPPHS
jgi:hypothetical protein